MAATITEKDMNGWKFRTTKTHIMASRSEAWAQYSENFTFPLPGEVFNDNTLYIAHETSGFTLNFNAHDALAMVMKDSNGVTVACASDWVATRPNSHHLDAVKPYDWTYTSTYSGTVVAAPSPAIPAPNRIDMEALKLPEIIEFYDDVVLFVDDFRSPI